MPRAGRDLERLVEILEKHLDGSGAEVKSPYFLARPDGLAPQEVDVALLTRIGSAEITVIFQVRDRSQVQEASWLRELVGLKSEFRLSTVVGVSSSGFTKGARRTAAQEGITLRTLDELTSEEVSELPWLCFREVETFVPHFRLLGATIYAEQDGNTSPEVTSAMQRALGHDRSRTIDKVMSWAKDGSPFSLVAAMRRLPGDLLFAGVVPNSSAVRKDFAFASADPTECAQLLTDIGPVPIKRMEVACEVWIERTTVPISLARRYTADDRTLATTITWEWNAPQGPLICEVHRMASSDETVVTVRPRQDPPSHRPKLTPARIDACESESPTRVQEAP